MPRTSHTTLLIGIPWAAPLRPGHQRAFTLIELLIVISVIALLAALLLPSISLVKSQAKQTDCANRLRQMGMMFSAYTSGNDGILPIGSGTLSWGSWYKALTEDTTNASTVTQGIADLQSTGAIEYAKLFYCSEDRCTPTTQTGSKIAWNFYRVSHGYNSHGLGGSGWTSFATNDYRTPAPLSQIRRSAETILCADNVDTTNTLDSSTGLYLGLPSGATNGLFYGHGLCGSDSTCRAYPRHRNRIANILWVDGHTSGVAVATYTDLYLATYLGYNPGSPMQPTASAYVDTCWDRN